MSEGVPASATTCTIDGCGGTRLARGWCSKHYQRWRKWGDPLALNPVPYKWPDNFLSGYEIDPVSGCWLWQGTRNNNGYGVTSRTGIKVYAHRASYEYFVGPIPAGLELDHLCRVRHCVNPEHLEPVTHRENARRGLRGFLTTHCPRGHEYTEANTYTQPSGSRRCRTCAAEAEARRVR